MTRYIKFNELGLNPVEAPKQIEKNGKLVFGYNKPSNEEMLLADGYIRYDGNEPLSNLQLMNGQIALINIPSFASRTVFSKLQIRRAMRALGQEEKLDQIISGGSSTFAKDWNDAQDIDLNDPVFREALQQWEISQAELDQIISQID